MLTSDNLLRGEKVRLAAIQKEDAAVIAGWFDNTVFGRLADSRPAWPRHAGAEEKWITDSQESNQIVTFSIRRLTDDQMIGILELEGIEWTNGSGWLGIAIGSSEHWGQGYGAEAIGLLLRFAFHELNLHRIQLTVFGYNQRAIALYERLGFVHEGTFREALHRDGVRHDMQLYSLLRREWEAGQPSA